MPALTDAELADARAMQAMAMKDECTIERYTGESVWDPVTETTTRDTTTVYPVGDAPGICRAQASITRGQRAAVSADEQITTASYAVAIPWDHTDVEIGDILTVTSSADPRLPDLVLRVADVEASTFATARHLTCTTNLD